MTYMATHLKNGPLNTAPSFDARILEREQGVTTWTKDQICRALDLESQGTIDPAMITRALARLPDKRARYGEFEALPTPCREHVLAPLVKEEGSQDPMHQGPPASDPPETTMQHEWLWASHKAACQNTEDASDTSRKKSPIPLYQRPQARNPSEQVVQSHYPWSNVKTIWLTFC